MPDPTKQPTPFFEDAIILPPVNRMVCIGHTRAIDFTGKGDVKQWYAINRIRNRTGESLAFEFTDRGEVIVRKAHLNDRNVWVITPLDDDTIHGGYHPPIIGG